MSLARVQFFSVSLDGFGTGEGLSLDAPFGHAGERLHEWMFETRWWHESVGQPGGTGGKLKFGRWDLAGKTGTIQDNKAVWFAGYAPNLAAAAVVADANLPYTNLMYGHTLDGRAGRRVGEAMLEMLERARTRA